MCAQSFQSDVHFWAPDLPRCCYRSFVGSDTCILREDKCNPSLFPE